MSLKLRPTGLGSGIDKDRPDYGVYSGELCIGRIYRTRGGPDSLEARLPFPIRPLRGLDLGRPSESPGEALPLGG